MKEKDTKLFDKTIHQFKFLIADIAKERKEHHNRLNILMREHDKKINKMIKNCLKIVNELYELFEDLNNENDT